MSRTYGKIISEIQIKLEIYVNNIFCFNFQYLQQIGYCPQNNCLNFALTARQLLKIFAYFRGYNYKNLDLVANHFLKMMR